MQVWLSRFTNELATRFLFTLPRALSIANSSAIDRETCKLGLMISITAPHITITNEPLAVQLYAMLRSHPAAYLSSCFIIYQSFAMRINSITSIWFALYLLRWTLVQSSTYDTLLELVDQQVHHGKSTDESRLLPKRMLMLGFQLSVFDFCFLHSIWSCQCSGANA